LPQHFFKFKNGSKVYNNLNNAISLKYIIDMQIIEEIFSEYSNFFVMVRVMYYEVYAIIKI